MCLPAVAGVMQNLSMGLQALGVITTVAAANQQAKATANMYEYQKQINKRNAELATRQAQDASERGFEREQELRRKAAAMKAAQRAALASQGTAITSGSPLLILQDTAYQSELDAATIRYNAQLEKYGYLAQAQNYYADAAQNSAAAANARIMGRYNAIGSLLTGAASVADKWSVYRKNYPKPKISTSNSYVGMGDLKAIDRY